MLTEGMPGLSGSAGRNLENGEIRDPQFEDELYPVSTLS